MTRRRWHFQALDPHRMVELRERYSFAHTRSLRALWWLPFVHMGMLGSALLVVVFCLIAVFADQLFWFGVAIPFLVTTVLCLLALPWLALTARRLERERRMITRPVSRRHFMPAQTRSPLVDPTRPPVDRRWKRDDRR